MDISNTSSEYQKPKNLAGLGRRWGGQIIDTLITYFLILFVGRLAEFIGLPPNVVAVLALGTGVAYYLFSDAMPTAKAWVKSCWGCR